MLASALVISGVTLTSAIWGFRTTRKCRKYAGTIDTGPSAAEASDTGSPAPDNERQ
jgi:hypothetical protein